MKTREQKGWMRSLPILLTLIFAVTTFAVPAQKGLPGTCYSGRKVKSPAIVSVYAAPEKNYVTVRWVTKNQCMDGTYAIERSTDGETFEIIGLRRGIGMGPDVNMEYFFVDTEAPEGNVHYRIRHFSNDNSEMLSKSITAVGS